MTGDRRCTVTGSRRDGTHARSCTTLRWLGVIAPALYVRMTDEFRVLVGSGDYAAWVAVNGKDPGRQASEPAQRQARQNIPHQLGLSALTAGAVQAHTLWTRQRP
jgi:hypothetical protein